MGFGTGLAKASIDRKGGKEVNPMKIDTLFVAALLLTGTALWTRIAVQGLELALLSVVIEWSVDRIRAGARLLPNPVGAPR